MSGKIDVKTRAGASKDPRYSAYSEWYMEVTDEDEDKKVIVSPSFLELIDALVEIGKHEYMVDITRERRPYFPEYMRMIRSISDRIEESIPKITEEDLGPYRKINRRI